MTPPPAGTPWWAWLIAVVVLGLITTAGTVLANRPVRKKLEAVKRATDVAAHEVRPNSGGSMADAVNRIESKLTEHLTDATEHNAKVDARLDRLERRGWLSRLLGL